MSDAEKPAGEAAKPVVPEDLTPAVAKRVEALHTLQTERDELRKQWVEERKALEIKYAALYGAVYNKRKAVVAGEVEAEGAAGLAGADVKGIPEFWLRAMQNNNLMRDFIEEHDEKVLGEALQDVNMTYLEDMAGFRLDFTFGANEYFTNTVLSKTIKLPNLFAGDDEIGDIKGTEIEWKAGKNLTVKTVKKKVKKGKGKDKTVVKEEEVPSFFRFFETPDVASLEEDVDEEDEEAGQEKMELWQQIQTELAVAQELREKIIPNAINWFTGEAADEDDDEDEDDEDEDDEDGEEEDEEEEEEEEEAKPKKGKGGKKGGKKGRKGGDEDDEDDDAARAALADAFKKSATVGGTGVPEAGGEKPPECKNQ